MKRYLHLLATDQENGGGTSISKAVLWIISQIYDLLIYLRKVFYAIGIFKTHKLSVPVISVGNLTMGGVGKTPLVAFIAQALKEKGGFPVILTRGYMFERSQQSDEGQMLRNMLADVPVLVGSDRVKNAQDFLKSSDRAIFILDDGFQHWRLSREIDIVAVDATNPWGNGYLLPRGILRERKSALARADVFVLTKADLGEDHVSEVKGQLMAINNRALMVEAIHKPVTFFDLRSQRDVGLKSFSYQTACALSSIGAPDSFFATLKRLDVDVVEHRAFMDHHVYTQGDVHNIVQLCRKRDIKIILTTEKDAVKLRNFLDVIPNDIRVSSLRITMAMISGEDVFLERINRLL